MTIPNVVKVTDEGLFIPHEAFESFGEIEVVRTPDSIIIQPKYKSRQEILQVLQKTGLLLNRQQVLFPQRSVSPDEQAELAHKFSAGRPLSEIIIEEREERW
jgi:hypothetical protein